MSSTTRAGRTRPFTMRMRCSHHDKLSNAADESGITMSALVSYIIAQYLNSQDKQAKAA